MNMVFIVPNEFLIQFIRPVRKSAQGEGFFLAENHVLKPMM